MPPFDTIFFSTQIMCNSKQKTEAISVKRRCTEACSIQGPVEGKNTRMGHGIVSRSHFACTCTNLLLAVLLLSIPKMTLLDLKELSAEWKEELDKVVCPIHSQCVQYSQHFRAVILVQRAEWLGRLEMKLR